MVDMLFNLGLPKLLKFKNTLAAIRQGDYERAARGMLNSKWARQVGRRAKELAEMMRTGEWPNG
jgi:lysozyme